MKRVKGMYVRDDRQMVPVFQVSDDKESIDLGVALEDGFAKVVREYIQLGYEEDISTEIIQWGTRRFAIMTITPGGYLGRMKKQTKRATTKAVKASKGNG